MICTGCGAESAAGMRFCGHCGARLERRHQMAERRQLTVLFCDLVGSSALAEALDPEEYGELLTAYQRTVTEVVTSHGGHVAQLLGDGLLVYFGYPTAHENSPDLAVAAAAGVIARLRRATAAGDVGGPGESPELRVRIGVHTGPVVIDPRTPVKERRNLALGNTPNVAARLQQAAAPGAILMSGETRRLLHTRPVLRDLGARELKGMSKPVHIWQVLEGDREQRIPSRGRVFSPGPMVGRESELAALDDRFEEVLGGSGRVILIEGEGGMGKSRLVDRFASKNGDRAEILTAGCSALRQGSALFPLRQLLRATLDPAAADSEQDQLTALMDDLEGMDLGALAPVALAALLRLPVEDRRLRDMSPAMRRRVTHAALVRWLLSRARRRPVVLIVEDLHWSDPSTLEWLGELLAEIGDSALLLLMTGRPGAWERPGAGVERLSLSGLSRPQAEELIRAISGREALSASWLERLIEQTDGVPLYLEELTRGLLEASGEAVGAEQWSELGIPSSLQELLTARLDRLGAAKGLAQWAAVIGRTFSLVTLRRLTAVADGELDARLGELLDAGVLEREEGAGKRYRFRHAMLQEAAYRSLLRAERRDRHRAVAETLAAGGREIEAGAGEIAHHFAGAGSMLRAAAWWLEAGNEALARSENEESIAFLRQGVDALEAVEAADRESLLLALEGSLATALTAAHGYAAAEVEALHDSVRKRAGRLGDSREIFTALRHTLPFYLVRAQHRHARAIGEELVEMADRLADDALLLEARLALATACFWLGEAEESRRQAGLGLALYRTEVHAAHAVEFGEEPGSLSHLYAAWSCWWLGSFAAARAHLESALRLARGSNHPHTLAMALDHGCSLRLYFQEWREARALVAEQLEISARYGFSMWSAMGGFRSAWLDCLEGELESGIARMEAGLAAFQATGAEIARPLHLSYLAHAHLLAGSSEAGLAVVAEALATAEANDESHYTAELYRLRGELILVADGEPTARARDAFLTAVRIARRQGAKALELRAALSWRRAAGGGGGGADGAADEALRRVTAALEEAGEAPDLEAARTVLAGA